MEIDWSKRYYRLLLNVWLAVILDKAKPHLRTGA
jgi:hypothetical protein